MGNISRKIGLVTVTFNSADVIDGFIQSISRQTYSNFVVYVIDNASKDDIASKVLARVDERLLWMPNSINLGVAKGNNQGIERALAEGCDFILLINNDTEFPPDLLEKLVHEADRLNADMLVPKKLFFNPSNVIWCAGGSFNRLKGYATMHRGEGLVDEGQFDAAVQVEYTPTCCMLIRAEVFKRIGLMDEKFFVYYDDTDFCLRALRAGLRLWYTPATRIFHKVGSLTGGNQSDFGIRYGARNKVYFIRKHLGIAKIVLIPIYCIYSVALFLIGRDNYRQCKIRLQALREGLTV